MLLSNHNISRHAINKNTGQCIHPNEANKNDHYICIECRKEAVLCKGTKISPYFRHKQSTSIPCNFYNNCQGESEIHKQAKIYLKAILESKIPISLVRTCCSCKDDEEHIIPEICESSSIELEYRFEYNGNNCVADVAYIDNGNIFCIFEIYNTHKTQNEKRPEPWFEIEAKTLLDIFSENQKQYKIPCIRIEKCDECLEKDEKKILMKNKALEVLCSWIIPGNDIIPPFYNDPDCDISSYKRNVHSKYTNGLCDLVVYTSADYTDCNEEQYERFHIYLIHCNNNEVPKLLYKNNIVDLVDSDISVYYLDIKWILSQTEVPKYIHYIKSLDKYDYKYDYPPWRFKNCRCNNCDWDFPYWVERTSDKTYNSYSVKCIGCIGCISFNNKNEHESNYLECLKCEKKCLLSLTDTNIISKYYCKTCDNNERMLRDNHKLTLRSEALSKLQHMVQIQ